jgi:hypothetical protein
MASWVLHSHGLKIRKSALLKQKAEKLPHHTICLVLFFLCLALFFMSGANASHFRGMVTWFLSTGARAAVWIFM